MKWHLANWLRNLADRLYPQRATFTYTMNHYTGPTLYKINDGPWRQL